MFSLLRWICILQVLPVLECLCDFFSYPLVICVVKVTLTSLDTFFYAFGAKLKGWLALYTNLILYVFSLCGIIPGLSSVLLPRMNPFVLINVAGALSLSITYMLIEIK